MTDCQYEITATDADGINTLVCPRCGHEARSKYPPALVHTRCGSSEPIQPPTPAELIERIRLELASVSFDELPAMLPEIARRVVICHRNDCGKFNGQVCTDRGSGCTHRQRWLERLAIGQCGQWATSTPRQ